MATRRTIRPTRLGLFALTTALVATGIALPTRAAHAAQGTVTGAKLEWAVNDEVQSPPPFGGCNYLSAGESDGTQATYAATAVDAAIVKNGASPTWANHCTFTAGKANQKFVLSNGTGTLNSTTGASTIQWTGTVSVNFYGGALPFWFENPRLTVAADGTGRITATVGGYASDRDNPTVKVLLPEVPNVVIATFVNVPGANGTGFTIAPRFAGVVYQAPSGGTPQNRTTPGWGSWPTPFVSFQEQTGLGSYWYTSGSGFDPRKPPSPVTVRYGSYASSPSAPGRPTAVAAKPGATTKGTGAVAVSYRGPADNGGSAILGYVATCTSSNGGATRSAERSGASTAPISVGQLTTGRKYACAVAARNAIGTGLKSDASPAVTVGAPAPPTNVRAVKPAARTLRVTYKLRANNGATIRSQTATCRPNGTGATKSATHNGTQAAPIKVSGLTVGKRYTCTVTTRNSRGVSLPSAPSNAVKV